MAAIQLIPRPIPISLTPEICKFRTVSPMMEYYGSWKVMVKDKDGFRNMNRTFYMHRRDCLLLHYLFYIPMWRSQRTVCFKPSLLMGMWHD